MALENAYNAAYEYATEALSDIDDVLFHIEKHVTDGLLGEIKEIARRASKTLDRYVVNERAEALVSEIETLKTIIRVSPVDTGKKLVGRVIHRELKTKEIDYAAVATSLGKIKDILTEAVGKIAPNFFALGYYLTFAADPLPDMPTDALNAYLRKYLDDNYMLEFIRLAKSGIEHSAAQSLENKKKAVEVIDAIRPTFTRDAYERKDIDDAVKTLVAAVENGIDRLETVKDNVAYTFGSSIGAAIALYFDGIRRNEKEEQRYAKQKANYDRKVAEGKTPDWKVADKNLVDLEAAKTGIIALVDRIRDKYTRDIEAFEQIDFDARTVAMIDYLKDKASGVARKVTHGMAKAHAIKLMEEVGIPEPRKRFRQYPFELSGGMRQRIVIAIALSADPDILICDEPTTALDVTIQSQILELINKVKAERKLSIIFITHDLGVVANMADRVAVMYAGKIVEIGSSNDIFYDPRHPYTWALLSSMPDLDTKEKLEAIPGTPPNMIFPPKGDAFADRNKYAMQIDFEEQPPMFKVTDSHYAATWLLHPDAPKVDPPTAVTDRIARMKKAWADEETAASVDTAAFVEKPAAEKPAAKKTAKKTAAKKTATKKTAEKAVKEKTEKKGGAKRG